jgi:hypothetical protein
VRAKYNLNKQLLTNEKSFMNKNKIAGAAVIILLLTNTVTFGSNGLPQNTPPPQITIGTISAAGDNFVITYSPHSDTDPDNDPVESRLHLPVHGPGMFTRFLRRTTYSSIPVGWTKISPKERLSAQKEVWSAGFISNLRLGQMISGLI